MRNKMIWNGIELPDIERYFMGDVADIPSGCSVTITFELSPLFRTYILTAYADKRTGLGYEWQFNTQKRKGNEIYRWILLRKWHWLWRLLRICPVSDRICSLEVQNKIEPIQSICYYIQGIAIRRRQP